MVHASPPIAAPAQDEGRAARLLAGLAAALLVAGLPLLMLPANRSSPLTLSLAALAAAAAVWSAAGPRALAGRVAALLRTPEALVGAAFLAWAVLSFAWSIDRRASLAAFGEFLVPLAASVLLCAALPRRLPAWATLALAASLVVVAVVVAIEVRLDFPLRRLWHGRLETFVMNRPIVTAAVVFWPLAAALRARGRTGLAAAVALAVALGALLSTSGTSKLAVAVGALAFAAALAAPRAVRALLVAGLLALTLAQPWFGQAAERALPEAALQALARAHARERLDIWLAFGEYARLRPWTGAGFGSSPAAARDPLAPAISPARQDMLGVGHPHDALLQVWTELGAPGAALALALVALLGRRLWRMPDAVLPERLACLAAVAAVALESHGAWQGWWAAGVGAAVVLFTRLPAPGEPPAPA